MKYNELFLISKSVLTRMKTFDKKIKEFKEMLDYAGMPQCL